MIQKLFTDLIFSINTVLPVFLVVMVGWYIRHRGTVDDHFVGSVSNLVFYYALPAMMFQDVVGSDFSQMANLRFLLLTVICTLIIFGLSWAFFAIRYRDPRVTGAAARAIVTAVFGSTVTMTVGIMILRMLQVI